MVNRAKEEEGTSRFHTHVGKGIAIGITFVARPEMAARKDFRAAILLGDAGACNNLTHCLCISRGIRVTSMGSMVAAMKAWIRYSIQGNTLAACSWNGLEGICEMNQGFGDKSLLFVSPPERCLGSKEMIIERKPKWIETKLVGTDRLVE
jgi:hypothetical protein